MKLTIGLLALAALVSVEANHNPKGKGPLGQQATFPLKKRSEHQGFGHASGEPLVKRAIPFGSTNKIPPVTPLVKRKEGGLPAFKGHRLGKRSSAEDDRADYLMELMTGKKAAVKK
jgi:hypothetical protein